MVGPPGASPRPSPGVAALAGELDALAHFGLTGVVLVSHGDEIALAWAHGLADRARGVPLTLDTVTDVGSVSKQFTAAAVMALADDGALDPDDPVARFLPDVPQDKSTLTLHHLLTHTAGFGREHFAHDFEPMDAEEARARILALPIVAAPGTTFSYSNSGYGLLGLVVEAVAGTSFQAFAHERLLEPAGLSRTGWSNEPGLAGLPTAHGRTGDRDHGDPYRYPGPSWALLANGGVLSTAADLHRWVLALRRGAVLSEAAMRRLHTPALAGYAYGWEVRTDPRLGRVVEHGGVSDFGHSALLRSFEDCDVTFVALFNATHRGQPLVRVAGRRLADGVFAPLHPAAPRLAAAAGPPAPPCGLHRGEDGATFEIWREPDGATQIGAADAAAVAHLTGEAVDAVAAARGSASLALVRELAAGDVDAVRAALHAAGAPDGAEQELARVWRELLGDGRATGFELIGAEGALPDDDTAAWSEQPPLATLFVRIELAGAPVARGCLRLVWSDAALVGIQVGTCDPRRLAAVSLAPDGDGWVGFDLRRLRSAELRPAADGLRLIAEGCALTLRPA